MTRIGEIPKERDEEFRRLLTDISLKSQNLQEGTMIRGKVVEVQPTRVIVDVGFKAEGAIPIEEFPKDSEGNPQVKPGDEVDAIVERVIEEWGILLLSKEKADRLRAWEELEKRAQDGGVIEGKVIGRLKGGFSVDIGGFRAFLPISQADLKTPTNPDEFLNKTFTFKVLKLNKFRNNVVLSRRAVLEEERERTRKLLMEKLKVGDIVKGVVKNITDYGAFIDLGGVDGLLHITDMSWGRLEHPSQMVSIGDTIEVMILNFDKEKERISLGLKQKTPDPWLKVEDTYHPGDIVEGKVISITDYGAFVELAPGIEGLIHYSEMSWTQKNVRPHEVVSLGQKVKVKILQIDSSSRRISLSLRETQPNPWRIVQETFPPGSILEGEVKKVVDYGIFVQVWEDILGLVHLNDLSWLRVFQHPSEKYKVGDKVRAMVESVDISHERVTLTIKKLLPNPWEEFLKKHPPGTKIPAKVVSKTDFGAFLEVAPGMEGLLHRSEIPGEALETLKVGEELEVTVIHVDPSEQRISLTMRNLTPEEIQKAKPKPSALEKEIREKILKEGEENSPAS